MPSKNISLVQMDIIRLRFGMGRTMLTAVSIVYHSGVIRAAVIWNVRLQL